MRIDGTNGELVRDEIKVSFLRMAGKNTSAIDKRKFWFKIELKFRLDISHHKSLIV